MAGEPKVIARAARRLMVLTLALITAAPAAVIANTPSAAPAKRPNIVLIVVDDAALMDFGAFGGEARTPNIDRLANRGAMFTAYHTSPLCSPSRAMILTGVDNHRAGVATIEEILPPSQKGKPGYGLHIEPGVMTIADRLRTQGYRTLMSGKWHLGHGAGDLPNAHGFDRSLALDASGADNWSAKPYMPYYDEAPWFEDGQPVEMPERYYSSDLIVDRLVSYIDAKPPGEQPFFGYLAFQAVHIPVQAPKAYSDHYKGRFDQGWEAVRKARAERARTLGLLPADAAVADMPDFARAWDELSPKERKIYARSMEVYSGMLEAMDAAIGRLMTRLAARGELENTLFVVTSDNGPEPTDPVHAPGMNIWMALHGYDWKLDNLGEPGSLAHIGREWASAISSPGQLFKFYASEGGVRAPLIISGPGVTQGARLTAPAFVTDVAPTLVDYLQIPADPKAKIMDGRSLMPVLTGAAQITHGPDTSVGMEVSGNAALYRGDYKITRNMAPIGDGQWRLFNLKTDPGETRNLAKEEPERFQQMLKDYAAYEERVGVAPLPPGYTTNKQLAGNALAKQKKPFLAVLVALLALGVGGALLVLRRRRRKRS